MGDKKGTYQDGGRGGAQRGDSGSGRKWHRPLEEVIPTGVRRDVDGCADPGGGTELSRKTHGQTA